MKVCAETNVGEPTENVAISKARAAEEKMLLHLICTPSHLMSGAGPGIEHRPVDGGQNGKDYNASRDRVCHPAGGNVTETDGKPLAARPSRSAALGGLPTR